MAQHEHSVVSVAERMPMKTNNVPSRTVLGTIGNREVVGDFEGGIMTSDGGSMLLRQANTMFDVTGRLSSCFTDHRDPNRVEHTVDTMIGQRVFALALGYQDINDHDDLRKDSALAMALGHRDLTGSDRSRQRDRGNPLAGSSTLNRLELGRPDSADQDRYKRIAADQEWIDDLIVKLFIEMQGEEPDRIVLDVDATDDPMHGEQEGKFYHGYYESYCYLPLYITCGDHVLTARLRPSNIDAADGVVDEVDRIVGIIRNHWPNTKIVLRGDSGFCRDDIMTWCEENNLGYVFGFAKNQRLMARIETRLADAKNRSESSGERVREFLCFTYRTLRSWSRSRRVICKVECHPGRSNPRFLVTNLEADEYGAQEMYEELYCARGDMENRIKEHQLELFSDRTSTAFMRSNQLRLYFSVFAGILMLIIKKFGLSGTAMASAQSGKIRADLLKIAGVVRISVRKVWLSLTSVCPRKQLFFKIVENLKAAINARRVVAP